MTRKNDSRIMFFAKFFALSVRVSFFIESLLSLFGITVEFLVVKKLKGEKEYMWRIRVGDYRVLYTIEDTIRIVEVRKIGHRRNIYK